MPKYIFKGFVLFALVLFVTGCGVRAKQYVQVRDRVDQEMEGNAGYFAGTPQPEDRSHIKKTRKIYVLEFSKDPKPADDIDIDVEPVQYERSTPRRRTRSSERITLPSFDDVDTRQGTPTYVEYTVKKDDTLQKISKKFYDGYSKWPRIHQANKDRIKDPNRLKVGTVLRIPMDE